MLAELHCHTNCSKDRKIRVEGVNSAEEIVKTAVQKGIDAIAITDHDTVKAHSVAKSAAKKHGALFIPGIEVSTSAGHIVALGVEEMIRPDLSVDETLDIIHEQGGIGIASHPFDVRREGIGKQCIKCDAIEAFNALNLERLSNWRAVRFARNNRKPVTAGSDTHSTKMIGYGLNKIRADDSVDSIINAIKKGKNTIVGSYPDVSVIQKWSTQRLQLSYESTRNYIIKNYKWPKKQISLRMLSFVKKSPGNIDYVLLTMAYLGVGFAFVYNLGQQFMDL
ncbi:MAG: PHP domain-containing protein [Candidatus Aenigmarchaeota archaeon]|nr:PHP domain-containing protein [Candidatus Aenigmarchaeota archaeon]